MTNKTICFLNTNDGFSWYSTSRVYVKGCFSDTENVFYEKEKMLAYFEDTLDEEGLLKKVKNINGIFTVVFQLKDVLYVASDTSRIFPLFYTDVQGVIYLSDSFSFLKEKQEQVKFNSLSEAQFRASGYILGSKTLLENIQQTRSNEFLKISDKGIKQHFYFSYATTSVFKDNYESLRDRTIEVFEKSFIRFIKTLNNRQVVVPLSGGYDSRLIAVMLKKHGYTNVICFTYGKKRNKEAEISEKVAKQLGFKWFMVEYSEKMIQDAFKSKQFYEYIDYTSKSTSMPFFQEYFAVNYLKNNNLIALDSVFVPGHSGDALGGSQLIRVVPKKIKANQVSSLYCRLKYTYSLISNTDKKATQKELNSILLTHDFLYENKKGYSVFEDLDIKEKFSKFLFNSSNVYNFFGYEMRFPFWDLELLSHFKEVPFKYKKGKVLFDDILKAEYFEPYNVAFQKELQPSLHKLRVQKIKNKIKRTGIFASDKNRLLQNDILCYSEITAQMEIMMRNNGVELSSNITSYNDRIMEWYLYYNKGVLKNR